MWNTFNANPVFFLVYLLSFAHFTLCSTTSLVSAPMSIYHHLTNQKPTRCHLLFYFTYYALNMFRTLIYPSSGACDCVDELPHQSSCSQFVVCWSFCCGWYLMVSVLQVEALLQAAKRIPPNTSRNKSSNTQRTENKTTDVVIHQHSSRLLKMDILMSETCWAHNKWNKIASDIKLTFHSSATTVNVFVCLFEH